MSVFDIINTISQNKKLNPEIDFDSSYIPFLINKGLSLFSDTIFYSNEMNINNHLSKKMQYDYYFHSIHSRKRFSKWPKKITENENLELIKNVFGYNNEKAKTALSLLNEQQIKIIKESLVQGGMVNNG